MSLEPPPIRIAHETEPGRLAKIWALWYEKLYSQIGGSAGVLPVSAGGTGLSSGTPGGVLGFTDADTIASSVELSVNQIVLGGGAGATPRPLGSLGTATTVLHGNAAGAPTFGAVSLTADVSGILPLANGGTSASLVASNGGVVYSTASAFAINTPGSSGDWLKSAGAAAPVWTNPAALSKVDDTNVTLTLGGTPTTALLNAASLTLGWTGQLGLTRGGTAASLVAANGGVVYSGAAALAINTPGSSGDWLKSAGAGTPTWTNPAALTKTDDTNVTLTLGGAPSTALLNASSLTLGWTGQLGLTRGGTAASLVASNGGIVYSTGSALAILAGTATAGQILRSGASTTPAWSTPTFPNTATANKALVGDGTNIVLSTPTIPLTSSPSAGVILRGDGTNWVASTPTYPNSATSNKALVGDGTNIVLSTPTIPLTSAPSANKVMVGDGTNWVASTPTVPLTSSPSAGLMLRGNGTNWLASTNTWPDTTTVNHVLYATGSNAIGSGSGLTFDGTTLTANTLTVSTGSLTVTGGTVTTGAATALSLGTTGGTVSKMANVASAVNYLSVQPGATTAAVGVAAKGETNIDLSIYASGTGTINFFTGTTFTGDVVNTAARQVQIAHTASASRYLTFTGSNGGNPTISTSAGNLAITPLTVFATGLAVASTTGIYVDGGSDSLILEVSADVMGFKTGGTEAMRLNAARFLKASPSGTYAGSTSSYHELYSDNNGGNWAVIITAAAATTANQYGLKIRSAGDPNAADPYFLYCEGNATQRASIKTNGGFNNFQANDTNLSSRLSKLVLGEAPSAWGFFKQLHFVRSQYLDDRTGKVNTSLIAEDVHAIDPLCADWFSAGLMGTREHEINMRARLVIQELQSRVEQLETRQ